jgi:hypothetical protein
MACGPITIERVRIALLVMAVALPHASIAIELAPKADAHAQQDGVTLDAYALDDRVVFCINAEKDLSISAEYGVQFKAHRNDMRWWNESLPKRVTGKDDYFEMPLQIDLKIRGGLKKRHVDVDLGACSVGKYCTPISFRVTIPLRNSHRSVIACMKEF